MVIKPVKRLMTSLPPFVAGFLTARSLKSPGSVKTPGPFLPRFLRITLVSASKYFLTSALEALGLFRELREEFRFGNRLS